MNKRLIIAISGATGAAYGVRLLEELSQQPEVETHLVVSGPGMLNVASELDMDRATLRGLADEVHDVRNIGASIASGSFHSDGMIIAPCSVKTLACVATGVADNLIARAADVVLKERRRLVMLVRETPLNLVHLRNMVTVTEMGGIIFPPVPTLYMKPATLADMIDHTVGRLMELFDLDAAHLLEPWQGMIRDQSRK
ncbi:MAG: UbiX family flavin prenyltransferase [Gammaproteobacteria bacterium]|nr:UbiX family flavin prenyltransferase [Gammaproteobacteria bacterium]MDH3767265.1 UbiX family flavin prenyltransferase [Gammaproteobacteria bacterium]